MSAAVVLARAGDGAGVMRALRASLRELHAAAAGPSGMSLRQLEGRAGVIASAVRRVLAMIIALLRALADGLLLVDNVVRGTDAALALADVVRETVGALGVALTGAASLTGPSRAAPALADELRAALGLVRVEVVADALPRVHDIAAARGELARLIGRPGADDATGTLTAIARAIESNPAERESARAALRSA